MIHYDEKKNLATYRPAGVFDRDLASKLLEFLQALEDSLPTSFNRLVDLTEIKEIRISGADLYRLAKIRRAAGEKMEACRTGIFAPTILTHAIAKLYEDLMEGSNIRVRVFYQIDETAKWLGLPGSALGLHPVDDPRGPARRAPMIRRHQNNG